MHLAPTSYPGNTWLDMDAETSAYYEGKLLGTVSISGYSEEYREHQLLIAPMLQLSLESTSTLPVIPLDKIVQRIQTLKISPTSEDNEGLRGLIGLSQYVDQSKFSYFQESKCSVGWQPCSPGSKVTDKDKLRLSVWD